MTRLYVDRHVYTINDLIGWDSTHHSHQRIPFMGQVREAHGQNLDDSPEQIDWARISCLILRNGGSKPIRPRAVMPYIFENYYISTSKREIFGSILSIAGLVS